MRENAKLKERLEKKYMNLKLYDKDNDDKLLTCRKACFEKERGNNRYVIFEAAEGFDPEKDDNKASNFPLWSPFDLDETLYDCICEYYTANPNEDRVELYEPFTGVESDYDDER